MAHEYRATIAWRREASVEDFSKGRYSRGHEVRFDGGAEAYLASQEASFVTAEILNATGGTPLP